MSNLLAIVATAFLLVACGPESRSPVKLASSHHQIHGLTSDGYAILSESLDNDTRSLTARPVMGGWVSNIATLNSEDSVSISGRVVFASLTMPTSSMAVWSAPSGVHRTSRDIRSLPGTLQASADGAFFGFTAREALGKYEAFVAPVDLSSETAIFTGSNCLGTMRFVQRRVLSHHCQDLDSPMAVHAPDGWAPITLVANTSAPTWSADAQGERALVIAPPNGGGPGTAYIADLSTGDKRPIEDSALSPFMRGDGAVALYTKDGALKRFDVGSTGPVELIPDSVDHNLDVSPGFKYALYRTDAAELVLASIDAPSESQVLVQNMDDLPYGIFTANDGFVVFSTARSPEGYLVSYRATAGGNVQALAERITRLWALRGSWIAYAQILPESTNVDTAVDLFLKDVSSSAEPSLLASKVDQYSITMHPDMTHVLFSVFGGGAEADGVYGAPLP